MNDGIFFQTSLIAAFLGGIVALFAPCCISFLLPAYLGSVFKERSKILLMTGVFSLGIFIILLPVILGAYALASFFLTYHIYVYTIGALVMLAIGMISFLGIKLPIPMVNFEKRGNHTDVLSIFTLGIMSGITTSCCAPVLIGILTLSFLSPTFYQALLVGAFYVLGMVFPLYLSSFLISEKRMMTFSFFRKKWFSLKLFGLQYPILTSNIIAGSIFTLTGLITLYLVLTTGVAMDDQMNIFTRMIQTAIKLTDDAIRLIPAGQFTLSWVTALLALGFMTVALAKDLMGREWSLRTWLINNKNSLSTGFISSLLLSIFYFVFVSVVSRSIAYSIAQFLKYQYLMVPLIIGFGIQSGLYVYLKKGIQDSESLTEARTINTSSRVLSSGSMILCCVHHVTDFLPFIGLTGVAVFLTRYQTQFLFLGLVSTTTGIVLMTKMIKQLKQTKVI